MIPLAECCRTSPTVSPQQASSGGARYRSPDRQPQLTRMPLMVWLVVGVVACWLVKIVVELVELAEVGSGWLVVAGLSRAVS